MKPEGTRTESFASSYLNTSSLPPANSREMEFLQEQALQANCQEIADLYTMLQLKCKPGAQRLSIF